MPPERACRDAVHRRGVALESSEECAGLAMPHVDARVLATAEDKSRRRPTEAAAHEEPLRAMTGVAVEEIRHTRQGTHDRGFADRRGGVRTGRRDTQTASDIDIRGPHIVRCTLGVFIGDCKIPYVHLLRSCIRR
jgi:hypothetical protein